MATTANKAGIKISNLIKWNSYLDNIKIGDKPLAPFANQLAFLRSPELEILYGGGTRGGKACHILTRVITPFGWKYIKDIEVGDVISNPAGVNCVVIGKYPQGKRPCYKFTFQDGRECVVDEEHLWKARKSRKTSRKSNRNNAEDLNYEIMTTKQIIDYIDKGTKYNILVPLTKSVQFTRTYKKNMIRIDPYVLGVLLGDGCIANDEYYSISGIDNEVFKEVEKRTGWELKIYDRYAKINKNVCCEEDLLTDNLKFYGLYGKYSYEKFIPEYYKNASINIRTDLIKGLMDTDGYVDSRGHLSYYTTSKQLADDFIWIIRSLGGRASIQTKIPTYEYLGDKKTGREAYIVHFQIEDGERLVNITRKKERRKNKEFMGGITDPCLRIDKIEYVGEEECCCITVNHINGLFIIEDFIVTHNSFSLLMAAAQYIDQPNYNAIIFRKTYQELSKGDGLIPLSMKWFKPFEKDGVHWNSDNMQWEFPSGAILGFGYLASDNDKYKYIGQAYQFIGFDELTQQPEENYTFLFSRLVRDKTQLETDIPLRMRATTNPNGPHVGWVYDRFVNKRTKPNIRQKIIDQAQEKINANILKPEEFNEAYIKHRMPKFIPSLAEDNPYLDMISYMDSLDKLDPVTRAQLAKGNWEIRAIGNMFNREWFEKVPAAKVPVFDLIKVRYWDMAATREGDYTASCHLGYDKKQGVFYILDMKLLKLSPREIEREIYLSAIDDGPQTIIYMEREPGSAGIHNIDHYKRKVIPPGWMFREDRVSGDKEARARPLSAACDKELIKIAWSRKTDTWFDPVMEQLETFPEGEHDDAVDALASAFNILNKRLYSKSKYIGTMDWMVPTEKSTKDLPYGPKAEMTIDDLFKKNTPSF